MKALALDNEVEELEREMVMQEQLVQETIEKKIADASVGSSSWETDTAEKCDESEYESSSLSSWDSSISDSSIEIDGIQDEKMVSSQIESTAGQGKVGKQADLPSPLAESFQVSNIPSQTPNHSPPNHKEGLAASSDQLPILVGEKPSDQSTNTRKTRAKENIMQSRSGDIKNATKSLTIGAHLKKQKRKHAVKKSKYGDDISLGTLKVSKSMKVELTDSTVGTSHGINKTQERPWIVNAKSINLNQPDAQVTSIKNEKPISGEGSFHFSHSFVTRISQSEEDAESLGVLFSSKDVDGSTDNDNKSDHNAESLDAEQSLVESLSNSLTSNGEEVLGLQEFENIKTRFAGILESKKAEFDTTWENIVADENVIAQINQRLRERQRVKENSKQKKKEKKGRK